MKKTVTKAQFSSKQLVLLRKVATTRDKSVSSVIEDALLSYISAGKTLPRFPRAGGPFCGFTLDTECLHKLKSMCEDSNLSWNQAVRFIVEDYINTLGVETRPME